MMESQTIRRFALKSNQQGLEFINPGEGSLTDEAMLVHVWVEIPFPPTLDGFAVALIFCNVGFDPTVPQHFPGCARIKAPIHVEYGSLVVQSTAFHVSEYVFELLFKLIAVIMVASNDTCCRNNIAISVSYWQDVAGFGLLSPLIGNRFAPFFAALWLPSRLSSDKFNSPLIVMILASKSRCRLPSLLHFRK